jgi:hypothetical protein
MKTLFAICLAAFHVAIWLLYAARRIRHSSFVIAASLVIGHSSFAAAQTQQLWWTASPDTNAAGVFIYGTTNAPDFAAASAPTAYVLRQDAGAAATALMTNVTPGVTGAGYSLN